MQREASLCLQLVAVCVTWLKRLTSAARHDKRLWCGPSQIQKEKIQHCGGAQTKRKKSQQSAVAAGD